MQYSRILVAVSVLGAAGLQSRTSSATNVCDETTPANRMVDGIPAYAQCTASNSASIYSNNGVDTATASGGTGWVRTQGSGGYQCTELAHRYLYFKWNVPSVPNGNAGVWCDGTIPNGLEKTTTPVHGDLIVFAPGSCGADPTTGHVAVIDVVNTNATVTFVEQNSAGRRSCAVSTAACFLHATANTGAGVDGGAPDVAGPDAGPAASADAVGLPDLGTDGRRADAFATGGAGGTLGAGGASGAGGDSGGGGRAGAGGAVGTGGAPAAGGSSGDGGALGAGGAMGTGGTRGTVVADRGGAGGAAMSTGPVATASSGCSCRLADARVPGEPGRGLVGLIVMVVALGAVLFGRRRSRG